MSADNWTRCPFCVEDANAKHAALVAQVEDGYGVMPLVEFDALRAQVAEGVKVDATWREDWEIGVYDAEAEVALIYTGRCTTCGNSVKIDESRPFSRSVQP